MQPGAGSEGQSFSSRLWPPVGPRSSRQDWGARPIPIPAVTPGECPASLLFRPRDPDGFSWSSCSASPPPHTEAHQPKSALGHWSLGDLRAQHHPSPVPPSFRTLWKPSMGQGLSLFFFICSEIHITMKFAVLTVFKCKVTFCFCGFNCPREFHMSGILSFCEDPPASRVGC